MNQATKAPPAIAWHKVESSQIARIGHDPETNTLAIQFKGKDGQPASVYHYDSFSSDDFKAFKGAESIGSRFFKNIKHNTKKHPYTKIS